MPRLFLPFADRLYNFEARDDDIWIVSFPKSGTTWTMEMVWMLVNNVDKEKAAEPATLRIPFTEMASMFGPDPEKLPFAPEMRVHVGSNLLRWEDAKVHSKGSQYTSSARLYSSWY